VVHFHYVPQADEVQPTERALASLPLQQQCLGGREFRVPPQATGPVDEISIEWAGRADDFDVLLSVLSTVVLTPEIVVVEHGFMRLRW